MNTVAIYLWLQSRGIIPYLIYKLYTLCLLVEIAPILANLYPARRALLTTLIGGIFDSRKVQNCSKFKSKWTIRESLSTISDRWSNELICNLLYSSTVLMFYQVIYDAKIAGLFTISLVYAIISIFILIRDGIKLSICNMVYWLYIRISETIIFRS